MKFRKIADDGPELSVIAFGCWPMGHWLWSGVDDNQSIKAVHRALDLGINFFDNADCYGFGHAETILSQALGERKKDVFIATKGGVRKLDDGNIVTDVTRDYLISACEASLKRLGVDRIDLYQVHWPNEATPVEETMSAINQLREQGKVRYVGVSNYSGKRIEASLEHGPLHTNQPPYNLLQREFETRSQPACDKANLRVLAYGPLCQGLLTGKYDKKNINFPAEDHRSTHREFREPRLSHNLNIIEQLREIADAAGRSLAELAVAWVLGRSERIFALCGAKNPSQIEGSASAADFELTQEQYFDIERIVAVERGEGGS